MIPTPSPRPRVALAVLFVASLCAVAVAFTPVSASVQVDDSAHAERRAWTATSSGAPDALAPNASLWLDDAAAGTRRAYTAALRPPMPGRYRLGVLGANALAHVTASAPGSSASLGTSSDPVEAWKGPNTDWIDSDGSPIEVTVEWTTAANGAAHARLYWQRAFDDDGGFPPEPVPSSALVAAHPSSGPRATDAVSMDALLERKGCWNCHPDDALEARGVAVQRRAPVLDDVAQRAGTAWIRDWIADPSAVRPHADMPRVLFGTDEEVRREATALARFLAGVTDAPEPSSAATEPEVLRRGRDLYHSVGCVACHGALVSPAELLDDPFHEAQVPASAPVAAFGALHGKWRPAALSAFLQDPLEVYPDGRMPSMNLDEEEADAIANYLADHFGPARDLPGDATDADVALGRKLFVMRDCGACHGLEVADLPVLDAAVPFAGLDASAACLSESDADALSPRYDLDAATRAALVDHVANGLTNPAAASPAREVAMAFERHACRACHATDGVGGPADDLKVYFWTREEETDLGDEGRFPPDLSGVGHKLTTPWMRRVLTDGGAARPYMATRMPQFGADHMDGLAELLAQQEGVVPDTDWDPPAITDAMVETGRGLMGLEAMACVTCHVYKDYPPLSTDGPDMTAFAERLRYEWWRGYIHDPQRYKPGTRMPSFGTGNVSSFHDVLGGDLSAQADALWAYMNLGDFMPVPEGLERETEMIIAVEDRPVVMRAFLPEVGARGIAVGFPSGLHVGYDAATARLVHAWAGEFLDAAGSWAGRGGSTNDELGDVVWEAPAGPALLFELSGDGWPEAQPESAPLEFLGYRIDADGAPTFESVLDGVRIEERITTRLTPDRAIVRRFRLSGLTDQRTIFINSRAHPIDVAGGELAAYAEDFDVEIAAWKAIEDPVIRLAIEMTPHADTVEFTLVETIR